MNNESPFGPVQWNDNSMLDSYRDCKRKYFYEWDQCLRSPGYGETGGPIYFAFGTAMHVGMEALYSHGLTKAVEEFDKVWMAWLQAGNTEDGKRTRANGFKLLYGYAEEYKEWMEACKPVQTEYKFSVSIPGYKQNEQCYRGIVDHVGIDNRTGEVYAMDFKTTTYNVPATMLAKRISNQFMGYWWALKCDPEYAPRLKGKFVVDFLISQTNGVDFVRVDAVVEDWMIKEWLEETAFTLRMLDMHRAVGVWPKSTEACVQFGSTCPYFSLCSTPPEQRAVLIEAGFEHRDRNDVSVVGGDW